MAQPTPVTITDTNGNAISISGASLGLFVAAGLPVMPTDVNGNPFTLTNATSGSQVSSPVPIVICDSRGYAYNLPIAVSSNGSNIISISSSTGSGRKGQPLPVCLTDINGNSLTISGATLGSFIGAPVSVCLSDNRGYPVTITLSSDGFSALTMPVRLVTATLETYDLAAGLFTLANGHILNIYQGGTDGANWASICMQQSADGGATWVPYSGTVYGGGTNPYGVLGQFYTALTGAGTGTESRNPTAIVSPAGSVIAFWETDTNSGSITILGGYFSRSTDNGATWTSPAALPTGYGVPTNSGGFVIPGGGVCPAYPSGLLVVPVLENDLSKIVMMVSSDDGVSWSVGSQVGTISGTEELALTWVGGNTLLGFSRTFNAALNIVYSYDAGTTWTQTATNLSLQQTTPAGSSGNNYYYEISPWIINDNPGVDNVTLLWCERSSWNGISPGLYNNFYSTTFDPLAAIAHPTGLPAPQLLAQTKQLGAVDGGYPAAVPKSSGNSTYLLQWMQARTAGDSSKTAQYQFYGTYTPGKVPTEILSISPISGTQNGGTAVTITGSGFKSGATVKFGTAAATSVVIVHPSLITCVSPANTAGSVVGVTITNTDGTTATLSNAYTNLSVALIASGTVASPISGNNTVTINSTGATLLVALWSGYTGASATVSDSLGNTWVQAPYTGETLNTSNAIIYYAYSHSGGALATGSGHVITFGGSSYAGGNVYAFSGTKTDSSVFGQSAGAGNSNLTPPISSLTFSSPTLGDILFCAMDQQGSPGAAGATISGNGDGNTWSTPLGRGSYLTIQAFWSSYALALSTTNSNPIWSCSSGMTHGVEVIAAFHSA